MGRRGPKPGSGGRPKKAIADRIADGNPGRRPLTVIDFGDSAADIEGQEMPGADVKALQELLMQLGYVLPKYGADGKYGSETEATVLDFQKDQEILQNGKYGSETHAALMDAVANDDEGNKDEPETDPTPETPRPAGTTVVIVSEGGKSISAQAMERSMPGFPLLRRERPLIVSPPPKTAGMPLPLAAVWDGCRAAIQKLFEIKGKEYGDDAGTAAGDSEIARHGRRVQANQRYPQLVAQYGQVLLPQGQCRGFAGRSGSIH